MTSSGGRFEISTDPWQNNRRQTGKYIYQVGATPGRGAGRADLRHAGSPGQPSCWVPRRGGEVLVRFVKSGSFILNVFYYRYPWPVSRVAGSRAAGRGSKSTRFGYFSGFPCPWSRFVGGFRLFLLPGGGFFQPFFVLRFLQNLRHFRLFFQIYLFLDNLLTLHIFSHFNHPGPFLSDFDHF